MIAVLFHERHVLQLYDRLMYSMMVCFYVVAASCSPHSLETPQNGRKNCSATGTGFRCDLTCDQSYTFYDYPGTSLRAIECTTGGSWPERIPACTPGNYI